MKDNMEEFVLVRFTRRSGKIDKTLEGIGCGMLKLWALQNTTKSKDCIVFSKDSGKVIMYTEGTDGFPKVSKDNLGHIDRYCPGLLQACQD